MLALLMLLTGRVSLPTMLSLSGRWPCVKNKPNQEWKCLVGGDNNAFKTDMSAGEVVQRVKALAAKPDDPSLVPGTNVVEGENRCPEIVL